MEDINQYVRNTYIIRRKLSELRRDSDSNFYKYWVGEKYLVRIFTHRIGDQEPDPVTDNIIRHEIADVFVYDLKRNSEGTLLHNLIDLERDPRFANYEPIKYKQPGLSNGDQMPINHLCELIKYLHIISKLTAFL